MASGWYNQGKSSVLSGAVNLTSDTIKVMLLGTGYTFSASHSFVSAIDAQEVSGAGYVGGFGGSGRLVLGSKAVAIVSGAAYFSAANPTWTSLSCGTVAGAALIKEITNDAASILIAFIDVNPDVVTTGANLQLQWNASGILEIA